MMKMSFRGSEINVDEKCPSEVGKSVLLANVLWRSESELLKILVPTTTTHIPSFVAVAYRTLDMCLFVISQSDQICKFDEVNLTEKVRLLPGGLLSPKL